MEILARSAFPEEHGWGWAASRDRLEAVHWLAPDATDKARMAAIRFTEGAVATVRDWAAAEGIALPRAVRNLVAEALPSDLPLWRLVILSEQAWPSGEYGEIAPIAPLLPEGTSATYRVLQALLAGSPVSEDDLQAVLGDESIRPLEWTIGRTLREQGPVPAARLVEMACGGGTRLTGRRKLQLVKRAAYYYPPTEPLTYASATALSRHHITVLLRWPHLIRMLEGLGVAPDDGRPAKTAVPVTDLVERLRDWRADLRREVLEAAIGALEARDYGSEAFAEMAADKGYWQVPADLVARFEAALRVPPDGNFPARTVPGASMVGRQLSGELGAAVEIVLSAPRDRVAVLERVKPRSRGKLVELLHPGDLIATLADPRLARDDSRAFIATIEPTTRAHQVLAFITGIGDSGVTGAAPILPDSVAADWLEMATPSAEERRVLVARGLRYLRPKSGTLDALVATDLWQLPHEDVLALLLQPDVSTAFRALPGDRWEALYRKATELVSLVGWLEPAAGAAPGTTWLDQAIGSSPEIALTYLLDSDLLVEPAIAGRIPAATLRDWLGGSDGPEHFQRIVGAAERRDVPLPQPFRDIALERPDLLELAGRIDPTMVPLRQTLEAALESREFAAVVDRTIPPARRWELLPWVRERYANHPARAVANEVAVAFGLSYAGYLRHLAGRVQLPVDDTRAGYQFDDLYRTYQLPKKSGGKRTITVPHRVLRGLQRTILSNGFEAVPLHPAATGFRKGLSIVDNAVPHAGKPIVVNIDIESCFPSTPHAAVVRACRQLCDGQLSPAAVRLVADICSFGGGLPIGAPTSPAIANVILRGVDRALAKAAQHRGVTYTRYADDLTFAGDEAAIRMIPFARRLLLELGYRLDRRKTNIYRRGRRQIVTGLVVNERPDLPRRTRRRLRAALHRRERGRTPQWHGRPIDDQTLNGWLAFQKMLRPAEGTLALERMRVARAGGSPQDATS